MESLSNSTNHQAALSLAARFEPTVRTSGGTRQSSIWFLTGQISDQENVRHIPIHSTPFRIGRRADLALCLPCRTVSGSHAEILDQGDHLVLRDLQSTNGTYVNGKRIQGECVVGPDDLIQFADIPFRVRRQSAESGGQTIHEDLCDHAMALVQFDRLMCTKAVLPFYQPIVEMANRQIIGYEVLGRSKVYGLETPSAMFRAAAQLDLEVELSRMFRWEGVRVAASLEEPPHVFVNTHPSELNKPGLLESLHAIRGISPQQLITLEIHEAAVTNVVFMSELRKGLNDLKIKLAFDDFGAGQNRLLELVEARPDFLKFDMSFIRDIHLASAQRQTMLQTLVRMVLDLGIVPLAEGIESETEGLACLQIGFQLAQGFHYGKPAPATMFGMNRQ